jgi:hypothetical protein
MQFNQSLPLLPRPKYAEGTGLSSERDSRNNSQLWKKGEISAGQIESLAQAVQKISREVAKQRRRIVGGGGGKSGWHKPNNNKYEVDATVAYDEGSVIHIQPTDSLVTTGIRDAAHPTGALVTSCAGYWVSTQDVPAKTTVSGNDVWNLPQYPIPVPTNVDDATNFWIYLGEAMP